MKTRTEGILVVLKIIAWIAMIGYSIEAGSKIISFVVSFFNIEAAKNLYKGLSYYDLRMQGEWQYIGVVSLVIAIAVMKVNVWIKVIQLFSDLNLQNPFKPKVAKLLETIAYILLTIVIVSIIANGQLEWVNRRFSLDYSSHSTEPYIFMAALTYIISQIFKRGIEIQEENELTV
jgi:hypothetical protein